MMLSLAHDVTPSPFFARARDDNPPNRTTQQFPASAKSGRQLLRDQKSPSRGPRPVAARDLPVPPASRFRLDPKPRETREKPGI